MSPFLWIISGFYTCLQSSLGLSFGGGGLQEKGEDIGDIFHIAGSITVVLNKNIKVFSLSSPSIISSWIFGAYHLRSIPLAIKISWRQLLSMKSMEDTLPSERQWSGQEQISILCKFDTLAAKWNSQIKAHLPYLCPPPSCWTVSALNDVWWFS